MMRLPRMILSTEGMEGSGKTHFALSAPRPLLLLDFDYGTEGVVTGADGFERKSYDLLAAIGQTDAEIKRFARETMRQFVADFRAAIRDGVRTLVVDTFSAAWAGQRLARGGDDKYIEYEEEFKSLVLPSPRNLATNVILIHHLRQDWARDSAGKSYKAKTWSRDGMDGVANMVQFAIKQRFVQPVPEQRAGALVVAAAVPGRFELDVMKCRDNIGFVGQTFTDMDFATLCGMVCPSVDWSR